MRGKYIEPSVQETRYNCPHPECGTLTGQIWHQLYTAKIESDGDTKGKPFIATENDLLKKIKDIKNNSEMNDEDKAEFIDIIENYYKKLIEGTPVLSTNSKGRYVYGELENVFLTKCSECGLPSLWIYDELIYPDFHRDIDPHQDMPENIKKYFEMAAEILDRAPPAAAALARLCVELLCKNLLKKDKIHLFSAIGELVREHGLDPRAQKKLDFVRYQGNEAIHPAELQLDDNLVTAKTTLLLVNQIVEEVISRPAELDRLYESIPDNFREKIDERDSN